MNFLGFRVSLLGRALHYHDPLLARVESSVESLTVGLGRSQDEGPPSVGVTNQGSSFGELPLGLGSLI